MQNSLSSANQSYDNAKNNDKICHVQALQPDDYAVSHWMLIILQR